MPMGLMNSSGTFQMAMEEVLQGLTWNCCLVFMDDILIYIKKFIDHIKDISKVISRLSDRGLIFKPKKCMFLLKEIPFLGHIVSGSGTQVEQEKVKAIKNMKARKDVSGVRRFLGMGGYYRKFIKDFASRTHFISVVIDKKIF